MPELRTTTQYCLFLDEQDALILRVVLEEARHALDTLTIEQEVLMAWLLDSRLPVFTGEDVFDQTPELHEHSQSNPFASEHQSKEHSEPQVDPNNIHSPY